MTDTEKLIERLRHYAHLQHGGAAWGFDGSAFVMQKAADRIEDLTKERDKLLDALHEIATDEHPLGWIAINAIADACRNQGGQVMHDIDRDGLEWINDDAPGLSDAELLAKLNGSDNYDMEFKRRFIALRAALDEAEAEKRAAVAAAYEKAADVAGKDFFDNAMTPSAAEHAAQIEEAIRALSSTDALAEYAEKVRAKAAKAAQLGANLGRPAEPGDESDA